MDERKIAPEIDFTPLLHPEPGQTLVVHCKTEDEAINFIRCLRNSYPSKCSNWEDGVTQWGKYKNMCYRPKLNMPNDYKLSYASLEHYLAEGYTVIPYEDLLIVDIEESEQRIDLLLS